MQFRLCLSPCFSYFYKYKKKKKKEKERRRTLGAVVYNLFFVCCCCSLLCPSLFGCWLLCGDFWLVSRTSVLFQHQIQSNPILYVSSFFPFLCFSLFFFFFFWFDLFFPFCFSVSKDWSVGSTAVRATNNNNYILSFLPSFLCVYLTLIFFFFSRNRNIVSLSLGSKSKNGVFCLIPSNKNGFQLDR